MTGFLARKVNGAWVAVIGTIPSSPVNKPPVAKFTPTPSGLTVAFDGSASSDPDGRIVKYEWSGSDGWTDTKTTPTTSHTFPASGSYTVALKVTDDRGLFSSTSATGTLTAPVVTPPPVTTPPVTTPPSSGVQPTGSGIDRIQDLTGSTLGNKLRASTKVVSFPTGTFEMSDFAEASGLMGVDANTVKGLAGAGSGYATIQMKASSSTKKSYVDGLGTSGTNQLSIVQLRNITGLTVKGIAFRGTTQPHIYNGLRVQNCAGPVLEDVLISRFPGNSQSPPGETFGDNHFSCSAPVWKNVEGDGGGVAASIFATNSCSGGITIDGMYVHDTYSSTHTSKQGACKGFAMWQQSGGGTIRRFKGRNNWADWGFERCTGTYVFYDPDLANSKLFAHLGNDGYSTPCKIEFRFTSAARLMPAAINFWCPATYRGVTNGQSVAADVKVYLDDKLQTGIAKSVGYPT